MSNMKIKWKCEKCHMITEGSVCVSNGYCPHCKEFHVLVRYDDKNPSFFEEKKSPI